MDFKIIVVFVCTLFLIFLLVFYFVPFNTINFEAKSGNYNFSIPEEGKTMQFYPNMRFSNSEISYRISDCSLQKQNDMESAFSMIEEITPLVFYPLHSHEEIYITCQDKNIINNGMFIAGEGGPTNITIAGEFNVITHGEIMLIRESVCQNPNVAMHELFHVLGFDHSENPENIMYSISDCEQTIGEDMIDLINTLYSVPSKPDLVFGDASAIMSGRLLNINISVRNAGLSDADSSTITIYANGKVVKEIDLVPISVGSGIMTTGNIFISQINVNEIELVINNNFSEMSKDNNKIKLEIK
jgi:hypothetical protein